MRRNAYFGLFFPIIVNGVVFGQKKVERISKGWLSHGYFVLTAHLTGLSQCLLGVRVYTWVCNIKYKYVFITTRMMGK